MVNKVKFYNVLRCISPTPITELLDISNRKRTEPVYLPRVAYHFFTRANALWEIHGFTLVL